MGVVVESSEEAVRAGLQTLTLQSSSTDLFQQAIPVKLNRVLIVAKKTRWDYEREKHEKLSESQFEELLRSRGTDVAELKAKHEKQKRTILDGIAHKLQAHNISFDYLTATNYPKVIGNADLVLSAGGDGTFLTAAALVTNPEKPVIGINTDPIGSEGHLCVGGKNPPSDLIERLIRGKFSWMFRNRIRVTILNGRHKSTSDKILALNEVFIGEREAAKVSYYEVAIDDGEMVKQKSSGIVVCTGTGSPAWNMSMNRMEQDNVSGMLEVLKGMGINLPGDLQSLAGQVAERVNRRLTFDPDHPNMMFTIREPIFNATFPRTASRGFASRLRLKSRCSNAYLVLDGTRKIPFNHGTEVLLEICEGDALKTITLQ